LRRAGVHRTKTRAFKTIKQKFKDGFHQKRGGTKGILKLGPAIREEKGVQKSEDKDRG